MSYFPHTQLIYFYLLDNPAAGHKNTFRENRTYFCNSPIFPNLSSKCFDFGVICFFLINHSMARLCVEITPLIYMWNYVWYTISKTHN